MKLTKDLTHGNETKVMIAFAVPMIIGNLFQQLYNVTDTIIVGKFIGADALAAVGSSFTLMVLLNSIILGLCMGSGVVFSTFFGAGNEEKLKNSFFTSLWFIGAVTIILYLITLPFIDEILYFIRIPEGIFDETKAYLKIILYGIGFTSVYNYFAAALRSMGDSVRPLLFLVVSALINIILDIIFVVPLNMGVEGAALATIIAQAVSGISIAVYSIFKIPQMRLKTENFYFDGGIIKMIANYSLLSSVQQSIMNFGILMIQGLVNSFGVAVMAAFTAAVKIESFAYMPLQDFGNAFSTFIAQNRGAKKQQRINNGIRSALKIITLYSAVISIFVIVFSGPLIGIFIKAGEGEIISIGKGYLYIVAGFYCLIGYLFMFYGLFRGAGKPGMSIILTIISLGTRVALAYALTAVPFIGLKGIWWSIPIGWALADLIGFYNIKCRVTADL